MKECTKCKVTKSLNEFGYDKRHTDGRQSQCRECYNQYLKHYRKLEHVRHKNNIAAAAWQKLNLDKHSSNVQRWRKANKTKVQAHSAVSYAIQEGVLDPSVYCEDCGLICKTQAHHEDYSKPLEVDWLCTSCHGLRRRMEVCHN